MIRKLRSEWRKMSDEEQAKTVWLIAHAAIFLALPFIAMVIE